MNIERPYMPILIIDSQEQNLELFIGQKNSSVALELDPTNKTVDGNILKILIEGDIPFLVLISITNENLNGSITPEMSELIKLCLFSKNYIRHDDFPVIAFTCREEGLPSMPADVCDAFVSELQQQGWPVIIQWRLPSLSFREQIFKKTASPLVLEQIDVDEYFLLQYFFGDISYIGKYMLFRSSETHTAGMLEEKFFHLCRSAVGRQPLLYEYLTCYLSAKKTGEVLENENQVLRERLNNAEGTIEVIRTKYKDDYDILFKWYQNEYEVLPLWYKRVGHILKVMTGRRTLRSLFSDDEKKTNGIN